MVQVEIMAVVDSDFDFSSLAWGATSKLMYFYTIYYATKNIFQMVIFLHSPYHYMRA